MSSAFSSRNFFVQSNTPFHFKRSFNSESASSVRFSPLGSISCVRKEFSPTWSCVSLTRSTTSSEWKLWAEHDWLQDGYFWRHVVEFCPYYFCSLLAHVHVAVDVQSIFKISIPVIIKIGESDIGMAKQQYNFWSVTAQAAFFPERVYISSLIFFSSLIISGQKFDENWQKNHKSLLCEIYMLQLCC